MIMLELLKKISNLGSAEAENLLVSAGQSVFKDMKSAHDWKKILVDTGEFFIGKWKYAETIKEIGETLLLDKKYLPFRICVPIRK